MLQKIKVPLLVVIAVLGLSLIAFQAVTVRGDSYIDDQGKPRCRSAYSEGCGNGCTRDVTCGPNGEFRTSACKCTSPTQPTCPVATVWNGSKCAATAKGTKDETDDQDPVPNGGEMVAKKKGKPGDPITRVEGNKALAGPSGGGSGSGGSGGGGGGSAGPRNVDVGGKCTQGGVIECKSGFCCGAGLCSGTSNGSDCATLAAGSGSVPASCGTNDKSGRCFGGKGYICDQDVDKWIPASSVTCEKGDAVDAVPEKCSPISGAAVACFNGKSYLCDSKSNTYVESPDANACGAGDQINDINTYCANNQGKVFNNNLPNMGAGTGKSCTKCSDIGRSETNTAGQTYYCNDPRRGWELQKVDPVAGAPTNVFQCPVNNLGSCVTGLLTGTAQELGLIPEESPSAASCNFDDYNCPPVNCADGNIAGAKGPGTDAVTCTYSRNGKTETIVASRCVNGQAQPGGEDVSNAFCADVSNDASPQNNNNNNANATCNFGNVECPKPSCAGVSVRFSSNGKQGKCIYTLDKGGASVEPVYYNCNNGVPEKREVFPDALCAGASLIDVVKNVFSPAKVNAQTLPDVINPEDLARGIYKIKFSGYKETEVKVLGSKVKMTYFEDKNGDGKKQAGEKALDPKTFTVNVAKVSDVSVYTINNGWNLVAFDFVSNSTNSAFKLAEEINKQNVRLLQISKYDNGSWVHAVFRIDEAGGFQKFGNDFNIAPGESYFVRAETAGAIELSGNHFTSAVPINMAKGWNLVAVQSPTAYTATTFINKCKQQKAECTTVSRFVDAGYESIIEKGGKFFGNDFDIEKTRGYFVLNNSERTTITP